MKRSQFIPTALFMAAMFLTVPQASLAGTTNQTPGATINTSDPQPRTFDAPNLDEKDGFDALTHKEKLRKKPKQVKHTKSSDQPLDKHNL